MSTTILTLPSVFFLAAHAFRMGSPGGAFFWLIAGFLAVSPAPWKNWVLAGLLAFGAWLWADVTLALVQQRMALGLPWMRLAAILGTITLLCLTAALINGRRAYANKTPGDLVQGLVFLLSVAGLAIARQKSSLDIILLDRFYPGGGWIVVILLGWYAAWIAGKMLQPGNSARWRRTIWTIFSAVFFLQLLLGLLGFERFLMTGSLHLPIPALIAAGPLYRGDGFFMLILFAVTLVLVGPAWCSHLCYIGAWDNLAATRSLSENALLPKLFVILKKQCSRYQLYGCACFYKTASILNKMPILGQAPGKPRAGTLPGWTKTLRWLICLAVLAVAILLGRSGLPVSFAIAAAAVFGLAGVGVMLIWSRRTGMMTHCTTYCPMGLLANIFGKINPWRIRMQSECCACGICSRSCRYGALSARDINDRHAGLTCTLCGDCIAACPHGHLHYRFPGLTENTARSAFIVVIVALHAIFLGVARL